MPAAVNASQEAIQPASKDVTAVDSKPTTADQAAFTPQTKEPTKEAPKEEEKKKEKPKRTKKE